MFAKVLRGRQCKQRFGIVYLFSGSRQVESEQILSLLLCRTFGNFYLREVLLEETVMR